MPDPHLELTGASHRETAPRRGEFCDLSGYLGDLPHRGASENFQKGRDVAQGQVGFDLGLSVPPG